MDVRAIRVAAQQVFLAAFSLGYLPWALGQAPAEEVERGRALYNQFCLICHGHELRGSPGSTVYELHRFPSDARERFVASVNNGKPPGMPAWKSQLSGQDLADLWAFVLSGGDPGRPAVGGR